jgi:antitoxin component of RelBE/YafQ-DinJ toxin-antitoxin module
MRIIQNEFVSFRCPQTLKQQLITLSEQSNLHMSHLIRIACSQIVRNAAETGEITQRVG